MLMAWMFLAKDELNADGVDLLLRSGNEMVLRATTLAPEFIRRLRIRTDIGLTGQVVDTRSILNVTEKLADQEMFAQYKGYGEEEFDSLLSVPQISKDHVVGILTFYRKSPWEPTDNERKIATEIAESFGNLQRVFESGSRAAAGSRSDAATQVTEIISRTPYLEEILQLLVNMTAQQFDFRVCSVRLLDETNQELVLRATQAVSKGYQRKRAIKLGESIAGKVIVEGRSVYVPDVQLEPNYIGHDLAREQGLRSMICIPLMIQDRAVGVLTCYTDEVRGIESDEQKALETIANQAAVTIEHAKLQVRHTLMQEMHHRVKNNLQQVVSLLRLQMRHKHYKNTEEALTDSLSRILAIASVHDLLSREDLDHVGICTISEALVQHQQQSFIPADKDIKFIIRGEDLRLNMNQATQVSLLINELIQNSVEHGFRVVNAGEIHISIESHDGGIGLWVSNNGDPLPTDFTPSEFSNLGLQIVRSLVGALGGTYVLENRLDWTVNEVFFSRQTSE